VLGLPTGRFSWFAALYVMDYTRVVMLYFCVDLLPHAQTSQAEVEIVE